MTTRVEIVKQAIWEAANSSWKPLGYEMVNFFTEAGLTPPNAADLAKFQLNNRGNIKLGSTSIAWCGIFATYVLKRYGKLDVHWEYWKKGKPSGLLGPGVNKATGSTLNLQGIRPGDVCVIQGPKDDPKHHHFIVTHVDLGRNLLQSVDGNSTNNEIVWHKDKKIFYDAKTKAEKQIYAHYILNI
jgi:hypothetical protein